MSQPSEPLPIDVALPEIAALLQHSHGLVVCAPPGAGKTTRVPRVLYDAGFARNGEILILQPRRIAARLAAARVAAELGERPGKTAGFTIRFENTAGPETRIRFITEGIFARLIVQDPRLADVAVVILDEFHERSLATDLALAFLHRLQCGERPDLKLLVMSATLEAEPIAGFLGGIPVVSAEGACFEVSLDYEDRERDVPLHEKVAKASSRLVREEVDGDILVFLPGAAEIRRAADSLRKLAAAAEMQVLPLHGDLSAAAQARAVQPAPQRKLILATNVAETSVTIPGIAAVIDSGLARVASHSSWSGLPLLSLAKVSKASAIQRAGRAGRTQAGRVLRLYTRHDYQSRPDYDIPEIRRADLTESVLTLHGAGIRDVGSFSWFDAPPEQALTAAESLLVQLGALDPSGTLTETGRHMLRYPLHPRLARLIVEGEKLGVTEESCLLAALIAERDILSDARTDFGGARQAKPALGVGPSDLLERADRFREADRARFEPQRLRSLGLDARAVEAVDRARRQLCRTRRRADRPAEPGQVEEALMIATLSAFPDRVARRRTTGKREFLLATGGSGRLAGDSVVHQAPLIVAVNAEERTGSKGTRDSSGILIRLASAVEPEWLAGMFPDAITGRTSLVWNESAGRVDEVRRTMYRELVLEETIRPAQPSEEVSQLLLQHARSRGLELFGDGSRISTMQARIALLAHHFPAAGLPEPDEGQIAAACADCCLGKRSLEELSRTSLLDVLQARLTSKQRDLLLRETPERITLPRGRKVPVHYEHGKPPWMASMLQDFFGMSATPSVCKGRVPLTLHLLAPNRRPVQVTQDLAGFWERHYPSLRRQLQRRYPKHAWPENPTAGK